MSMKIENTENTNELKLTFNIPAEVFDEGMKKVYKKTAKYFNIPGFRKGKAPMALVEKTYGSEIFYEDTFNEIVPELFDKEVAENNIEIVSKPQIDIVQIGKGKELIFTAVVETKPEVKLGKYNGIALKKNVYEVKDKDIQKELEKMAEKNARLISLEKGKVANKDIAVIDFEGFVDEVAFEGGKGENYELEVGSKTFIPGFEEQVIGMKVNEEKDINVKFPEEYFSKELAGKDAVFKVKLHEIKRKELPTLDDEFAKDVSEFDTIEELKNSIKEKLETENENKAKYELEDSAIEKVCKLANVEVPNGMVETEVDNMLKDIETRLSYQGLNLKQYLQMTGKNEADMRAEYKEQAEKSVRTRLVLEAIVKAEKLEVTDKEIAEKIEEMAKNYGKKAEELQGNEHLINYIKENMKIEKAIKFVVDNAKVK